MEDVADALKIATAVLIFVLALSISINAFGQARQTAKIILDYNDKTYDTKYIDGNNTTQRIVGIETIIPSMYKAYKESYKIVFDVEVFRQLNDDGRELPIYTIDLENMGFSGDSNVKEFIQVILYGTDDKDTKDKFKVNNKIIVPDKGEGFYEELKNNQYNEKLGVYYISDLSKKDETMLKSNETKKRVITYSKVK